jgi:predicted transcriptional regulator
MRPASECLQAGDNLQETVARIAQGSQRTWPVCDPSGVVGVVTLEQLQRSAHGAQPNKKVGDLLDAADFPHLHSDHSLDLALDRLGATHADLLPVVSRANVHQLLGVVHLQDVLKAYGVDNRPDT